MIESSFVKNIGKNKEREVKKGHNGWYWLNKINTNIKSDAKVNYELFCNGWVVVRFRGNDILKHTAECVNTIEDIIF